MTNAETIIEYARNRIAQEAAKFSISAGENVTVDGSFPSYVISGKATDDAQDGLAHFTLNPVMIVLGETYVTVTPGYIYDTYTDTFATPKIGGLSIFDTPRPTLTKYGTGGYVWLKRAVNVAVVDSGFGYDTIEASFPDEVFSIVTTPLSVPNPDTTYEATVWGYQHGAQNADFDFISITSEGFVHQMLGSYNSAGQYLIRNFGFFADASDTAHRPGYFTPFSYMVNPSNATQQVFGNIIAINP